MEELDTIVYEVIWNTGYYDNDDAKNSNVKGVGGIKVYDNYPDGLCFDWRVKTPSNTKTKMRKTNTKNVIGKTVFYHPIIY